MSREARYALEQLKETTVWDVEAGKFKAGLPYKKGREKTAEILNSVDSEATARRRMMSLKRSMEKKRVDLRLYQKVQGDIAKEILKIRLHSYSQI